MDNKLYLETGNVYSLVYNGKKIAHGDFVEVCRKALIVGFSLDQLVLAKAHMDENLHTAADFGVLNLDFIYSYDRYEKFNNNSGQMAQ